METKTSIFDLAQNEDWDGMPPAGMDLERECEEHQAERNRQISHHLMVDMTANELWDAGHRKDVAQAASMAFASLQRHAFNRTSVRLSVEDRDRLLTLLMAAREPVLEVVCDEQGPHRVPFAASAIDSAAILAICWSEEAPWDTRPREFVRDLFARVRWIRNLLHNVDIERQFQEQKSRRALQVVSDIQAQAIEAGRRYG
jgi:hypothetical protein